jgi:hypothetical protein
MRRVDIFKSLRANVQAVEGAAYDLWVASLSGPHAPGEHRHAYAIWQAASKSARSIEAHWNPDVVLDLLSDCIEPYDAHLPLQTLQPWDGQP